VYGLKAMSKEWTRKPSIRKTPALWPALNPVSQYVGVLPSAFFAASISIPK